MVPAVGGMFASCLHARRHPLVPVVHSGRGAEREQTSCMRQGESVQMMFEGIVGPLSYMYIVYDISVYIIRLYNGYII